MAWLPFQKLFAVSDYVFQSSQHFFNKKEPNFVIKVNKLAVGLFSVNSHRRQGSMVRVPTFLSIFIVVTAMMYPVGNKKGIDESVLKYVLKYVFAKYVFTLLNLTCRRDKYVHKCTYL